MWNKRRPQVRVTSDVAHKPANSRTDSALMGSTEFTRILHVEQKRSERSRRGFVLMLLDYDSLISEGFGEEDIVSALAQTTRETDLRGWYREGSIIGVIFTEIAPSDGKTVAAVLEAKTRKALENSAGVKLSSHVSLCFHIFPEDWHDPDAGVSAGQNRDSKLVRDTPGQASLVLKRSMDIVGSIFGLALFSPLLIPIAIAIKLTSKGPVLFHQKRVGLHGRKFNFLKFRSMNQSNDSAIHETYVRSLIEGTGSSHQTSDKKESAFKLVNDPRVTPLGVFLRRTSLDELPQFLNVLMGDMSLVGPRPPIPYEVACYQIWHSQRLLSVKPGITGLWQVNGRSRVRFDDMVRLDLRYARSWSVWLDLKILLRTPGAIFDGGAY